MGRHDWYRRSTWTANDQSEFRARLRRSRSPFHRAQYLRIQALYLETAGLLEPSIELLLEMLQNYGDAERATAHYQLASCHEKAGRIPEAVEHLRLALAAEVARPTTQTLAWLAFGRVAVEHGLVDLFDEFLILLETRSQGPGGLDA